MRIGTKIFFSVLATYVKGPRSFPRLIIDNHVYIKHRSSQRVSYWKCHFYDRGSCKARCSVHVDQTILLSGKHTCREVTLTDRLDIISQEFYTVRNTPTYLFNI